MFYEVLFGNDIRELSYVPKGLSFEYTTYLQGIAHEVVAAQRQRENSWGDAK